MAVISISLPDTLLSEVEDKVDRHGYSGRSDLTREALRSFIQEFDADAKLDGEVIATVTVVFREDSEVESTVSSLRHDYGGSVIGSSHSCIDEDRCMEVLVVRSDIEEVNEIVGRVRSTDGAVSTDYTAKPLGEISQ
ncbi:CopG family ribbon-helix-helix protein [Haladaptatus sp. F3-133]|jgi:CopG family nickel-responsive transcriptional regulator|uniref:CopG family ribbon-helix-helix protein n=1 Tax=Halorutilus salinus TaxID=2487751 RepID=A0A9Q4C4D0_9EURY|nr:CopG family ribbon-helix-helix protein [Halorutilus salinus]MCX2818729.1 CopG family ribbon-helix-helix protein [Halorutilus salinus]